MDYHIDQHAIASRLLYLTEELSAGCDPDFDANKEELEREFAELRITVYHN
jgi:hypothetical protein